MKILFPTINEDGLDQVLAQIAAESLFEPFDDILIKFSGALSSAILLNKDMRQFPEFMVVAEWMRCSHILELKNEFLRLKGERTLQAKGVVLHFAPSNVDTIFIYSWILSLLSGNSNIIRVSQNIGPAIRAFFEVLQGILKAEEFLVIANRLLVLTYGHNDEITAKLSSYCNMRVIWGGDQAISNVRKIPLPARSNEIIFADRFSYAAIAAASLLQISDSELSSLIKAFYKDTFTFNQKACSSPRLIFWIGEPDVINKAKERFWFGMRSYIKAKMPWQGIESAVAMTRLTAIFRYAALNKIDYMHNDFFDLPGRLHIKNLDEVVRNIHPGAGLFLESEKQTLEELGGELNQKDQTLVAFGFQPLEITRLVQKLPRGALDRIVSFGDALKFSHVWDGYNLLLAFTREIAIVGTK